MTKMPVGRPPPQKGRTKKKLKVYVFLEKKYIYIYSNLILMWYFCHLNKSYFIIY